MIMITIMITIATVIMILLVLLLLLLIMIIIMIIIIVIMIMITNTKVPRATFLVLPRGFARAPAPFAAYEGRGTLGFRPFGTQREPLVLRYFSNSCVLQKW